MRKRPRDGLLVLVVSMTAYLFSACGTTESITRMRLEETKAAAESLADAERQSGPEHPDVARHLNRLAELYASQSKHVEAVSLYKRSLTILEKALGENRPPVAIVLVRIAKSLGEMGENDEAERLRARAEELLVEVAANAYPLSRVDRPPRIISRIDPLYPFEAERKRIEGSVTVRFVVTKEGIPILPEVVKGNPPGVFDYSALKAILRWRFKPAIKDGELVDVMIIVPLRFALMP